MRLFYKESTIVFRTMPVYTVALKKQSWINRTTVLSLWVLLLGSMLACETVTRKENLKSDILRNDTLLISISTASGWSLDVYSAGDGVLKYRTKSKDAYYLAESTFQFDSLRRKIEKGLERASFQESPPLGVRIITSQYPNGLFYALQDQALAEDLFQMAFRAGVHDPAMERRSTRLRRTYRFHPPIPKE